MLSVIAFIIQD